MRAFEAEAVKDHGGRLAYIELPFDARQTFGRAKGTLFVKGMIDRTPYRGKLLSRGGGVYLLTLNKTLQKAIGFSGAALAAHVTMELDQGAESKAESAPDLLRGQMELIEAITTRQSVRRYAPRPVSRETLQTILYAGLCAPTAKDKRPCHFVILEDKALLCELAGANTNAGMLAGAACGIVVCGDGVVEGTRKFLYEDCAAAVQNMLLCIHGLGLGGVWCGVAANSAWQKLLAEKLGLPAKMEPAAVVALGYPAQEQRQKERWDAAKLHFEQW